MVVNNDLYKVEGDLWWDERQPFHVLRTGLNPPRLEYLERVFTRLGFSPAGRTVVDIGCGGGLLSEELASMGMRVIGVDPAEASLRAAREHARRSGLQIEYRGGVGERLPLNDGEVDLAVCVDVLEHVDDVQGVLRETGRVLRPDGLYLFDTINRTRLSRLAAITLAQQCRYTRWQPPELHDWEHFVRPDELQRAAAEAGLVVQDITGIVPAASLRAQYRSVRRLKKGAITYGEFGRLLRFELGDDLRVNYIGYAIAESRTAAPRART